LWGVTFGYPYTYHYDEPTYVRIALDLRQGIFGAQANPTGFANLLFSQYAAWFGTSALASRLCTGVSVSESWPAHPTIVLVLLGRLASAFLGTLTVALVYRLGLVLLGRAVGILSAGAIAVAFLHVRYSHYSVPDTAAAFFVCLTMLLAVVAIRQRRQKLVGLSAATAGLAVATKWTVVPIVVAVGLATVRVFGGQRASRSARMHGIASGLLGSGVLLLIGFAVGGFELLLEPRRYLDYLLLEFRAGAGGGFWIWQVDTVPGWVFYLKALACGVGWVPVAMALVGLGRRLLMAGRGRNLESIVVLSFLLPYFAAMGLTRHYFARYALPLVPFVAVFAAEGGVAVAVWLGARLRVRRRLIIGALAIVALAQPAALSVRHGILLTRTDTRALAKEWVEAQIPAGKKLALDWPVYSPPLSREMYVVREQGQLGLAKHSLDWYRREGFDYIVTSDFVYGLQLVDREQAAVRSAFYSSLGAELELIQEFNPYSGSEPLTITFEDIYGPATGLWRRERPGPVLRIYRVE
jgi:hypothetical protein